MRLEQRDSYLRRFASRVRELRQDDRGAWIALEASAFYPTSGGQPHDTGRLAGAAVTDVALADGEVWHRLEGPALEPGSEVEGVIDWDRRYRHMQRHSAQHLLSQAFVRVSAGFDTRSVSLRGSDCTLDLAGEPDDDALTAAEELVNTFAYAALPIVSFEVDERDVGDYPLRRAPKVRGRIRLVAMGDLEVAACGGTHLAGTAEAAPIKLLGSERVRGGLRRVTFRAGWDALDDYRAKHALAAGLVRRFSAPLPEVASRVERLEADAAEARAALRAERGERADELAERLLTGAGERGGVRLVAAEVDPAMLEPLSELLMQREATVALLAAREGARAQLSFVRGPGSSVDVLPALRAALSELGGRGGGKPERAQGAGPNVDAVERALRSAVEALALP
ncbi:MAG TPA: DHHA1 domain-containing protein [Trueperaceae bacterium]|nr:DHHA1 domain-containing protein [Trueperaceae bacterium]